MEFIAHRGLWLSADDKNSFHSFCEALKMGFGIEVDVRDFNGMLVVSHDPPIAGNFFPLQDLLDFYAAGNYRSTIAFNVKSDGLQVLAAKSLADFRIKNYFFFDMSIPDTLGYMSLNLNVFSRLSEYESPHQYFLENTAGIWLDSLEGEWIAEKNLVNLSSMSKRICIVSAELHRRNHIPLWNAIKGAIEYGVHEDLFQICTDLPREAKEYFL